MSGTTLRFVAANGAVVNLRNRERGDLRLEEAGQSQGLTDGAQVFAYDTQLRRTTYALEVQHISDAEREAFQAWFDNDAQGVFNTWTLTIPPHPRGSATSRTISNARFLEPALDWESVDEGYGGEVHSVRFAFFTEEEGPTGPPTS